MTSVFVCQNSVSLCNQSMQYFSLQHRTLLPSPVTSMPGYCFHFGSIFSFFLELFLPSSPVAFWEHIDLGSSSFSVISFLPFHSVHGVLKARILKRFAILFSTGPRFVRTLHHDPSILGGPTWQPCSFIELDKAVIQVISLISFLCLWFSFYLPSDGKG